MKVLERRNHFCRVELGVFLREALARSGLKRAEKLAAHAVLFRQLCVLASTEQSYVKHEEEVVGRLERVERVTMNGWFAVARISCSASALLILFRLIISFFDSTADMSFNQMRMFHGSPFMAKSLSVFFSLTR